MTPDEPPLAGPLRACAQGIYPDEAGIGLLIDHATFLRRQDFREHFIDVDSRDRGGRRADPATALRCSSGEEKSSDWPQAWPTAYL
jgi:hypothetical protein